MEPIKIKLKNINNWELQVTDSNDNKYDYVDDLCFVTKSGIEFFINPDEDITIEKYEGIDAILHFNGVGYITYIEEV